MSTLLPNPISQINNFIEISFPTGHHGTCTTPPGHILHLVTQGHYQLSINRHLLEAQAGDFIIYHDLDQVEWIQNTEPVCFYSILFNANQLPALAHDKRVRPAPQYPKPCFLDRFEKQFEHFHPPYHQQFSLCALLLDALQQFYPQQERENTEQHSAWQDLERQLRIAGYYRPSLNQCSAISGISSASLSRLSKQLYNQSPMQRLRFVRIEQAKSLLQLSSMSISQIANYLDYPRVHEFSREFKQQCQTSPSIFRQQSLQ